MAETEKTTEEMLREAVQKGEPVTAPLDAGPDGAGDAAGLVSEPALVSSKPASALSVASRLLIVGAVLLLLLGGYETYSSIPGEVPAFSARPFDAVSVDAMPDGIALNEAVDRFARRRVFGVPPPQDPPNGPDVPAARGWRAYVRDHMDLMGTSAVEEEGRSLLEAIMMDKKAGRMQFLREGMAFRIEDQEVTVVRVSENQVELRRGEEVLVVD